MLSRKPPEFKFDVQVKFVVAILLLDAIFGFSLTIYFLNDYAVYAWFYAM
jgi:hypothetical protein